MFSYIVINRLLNKNMLLRIDKIFKAVRQLTSMTRKAYLNLRDRIGRKDF